MPAKLLEDFVEVRFKGFGIAGFEGHPLMLDFAPQDFDAIELWAVGRQKVQGQSLLLEQVHHGLDRFCRVYRSVVQHDCQGFAHMLKQQTQKARKQLSRGVVPEFGAEQSTCAEHGPDDVEPFASHRCRGVAFTRRCPGVSVGLGLCESSFIDKGQGQLPSLGLCLEFFKFRLGTAKSGDISLFLSEWRVRFHTKPSRRKHSCTTQMLTVTLNCSCSRSRNCGAVSASARAQSHMTWMCSAGSLRGAPLRGASNRPSTPFASQASRCTATVSRSMPCSAATALMGLPLSSISNVRERWRALQSLPRSAMWANCWHSASVRTRGRGLRDIPLSYA